MSEREEKDEQEAQVERDIAALEGIVEARVDQDCPLCGLNIHVGDVVVPHEYGHAHPVCAAEYAASLAAEQRHDRDRERGL